MIKLLITDIYNRSDNISNYRYNLDWKIRSDYDRNKLISSLFWPFLVNNRAKSMYWSILGI